MNLIVAVTNNFGIGNKGDMLVHLPADLKYFKEKTTGKVVVMGLKTYYSLPVRPLPNRTTIVLTRNQNFKDDKVIICNSITQLFEKLEQYNSKDVFIAGGANIYSQLIYYCDTAYITKINTNLPADTFFPNIDQMENWQLIDSTVPQTNNNLEYTFNIYTNKRVKSINTY